MTASIYSGASDGRQGGDIYYVARCATGLLTRIILCDVQGHGSPVSELTTWIYGALRESMNTLEGNNVLTVLNETLFYKGSLARATAALITFNTSDARLYFSYAGHPPMLLRHRTGTKWSALMPHFDSNRTNLPLGMFAATSYDQDSISLEPGDRLALYTDGVIEAESETGEEFGQLRLCALLERFREHDISWITDRVVKELGAHSSGAAKEDDQTLMLIEIT